MKLESESVAEAFAGVPGTAGFAIAFPFLTGDAVVSGWSLAVALKNCV